METRNTNFFIDHPDLEAYFDKVQNVIKKKLAGPPYNVKSNKIEEFATRMFTDYNDNSSIVTVVNKYSQDLSDLSLQKCADEILGYKKNKKNDNPQNPGRFKNTKVNMIQDQPNMVNSTGELTIATDSYQFKNVMSFKQFENHAKS